MCVSHIYLKAQYNLDWDKSFIFHFFSPAKYPELPVAEETVINQHLTLISTLA